MLDNTNACRTFFATSLLTGVLMIGVAGPASATHIGSGDLANGAVTRAKIRNSAVNASKLAGSAVSSAKIATGAVTRLKIRDFTVNGSKIAGSAVTTPKIVNSAVTSSKLANNAKAAGADFLANAVTLALTAADQTVVSVAITAPGPGLVIVNASGYHSSPAAALARCSITTGTAMDFGNLILDAVADDGTFFRSSFAETRGFDVAGAGTTTYNLVCNEFSGQVTATASQITAIFVPQMY